MLLKTNNIFGYNPDNVVMLDVCARDITPQNFIVMVKNGLYSVTNKWKGLFVTCYNKT